MRDIGAPPLAWRAGRFYYGWVIVAALAFTETVSYGILTYAVPVFLAPMESELGWSRVATTGGISLSALVAGLAALPFGRWVDRHGARWLMTAGSVSASLLLLGWASAGTLGGYYLLCAGLGLAMAAVQYEPAFGVLAVWFDRLRGRALTALTFAGGFASMIFVPLATWLVHVLGWREALVWLAAILAVLTIPPHALVLRRRPQDLGLLPDGAEAQDVDPVVEAASSLAPGRGLASVPTAEAVRTRSFRWLAVAFTASTITTTAVTVHLIPLLLERGIGVAIAGVALGLLGGVALPGRLIITPLGDWWPRPMVTASVFGLQAMGLAVLALDDGMLALWSFVALFGAGLGAITPARAALLAELYGPLHFGAINGVLAMILAGSRAAAPIGASLLYAAGSGYGTVVWVLAACCVLSAVAVLRAGTPAEVPLQPSTEFADGAEVP